MKKNNLLHNLLGSYYFYNISQKIMSASSFRRKIINKIIKKKTNLNILDIGCGPAEILKSLNYSNYYGFDTNRNYINYAKKNYKKNCHFFCENFNAKKIKKIKFDYVILLGLLHHLNSQEINKLLKEIKKVLKKKGNLLTIDNIYIKNQNFIAKKLIDLDRGMFVRTKNEYLEILKKHFKNISSKIYIQKFIPYTWFVTKCFT